MARIVSVYTAARRRFAPVDMSLGRWWKMSEALAQLGHHVDLATNEPRRWYRRSTRMGPRLRRVPLDRVRWNDYDVIKTVFHEGFATLEKYGGDNHPYILSKLGSMVDRQERDGVYFHGDERDELFQIQQRIARRSRYVTLLTPESRALWHDCFGDRIQSLLVPGAVDDVIPSPAADPYTGARRPRCLFLGHIYHPSYQPEAHRHLVDSLNQLGRQLRERDFDLYHVGPGDRSRLDPSCLQVRGAVSYAESWGYMQYADVGVVLALGKRPNHNESTKIYHYLRAGLPVVCESGFPNQGLIEETGLGTVVPNGSMTAVADAVVAAAGQDWDRARAIHRIRFAHTWTHRARTYDQLFRDDDPRLQR